MAYQRFLNDHDYLALITQEGLEQLIREVHDRIPQAERSAEVSIMEYLSQYYEVEKELLKGKHIIQYSEMITYPAGVYFLYDNTIYRSLTAINGYKRPASQTYWSLVSDILSDEVLVKIQPYSQTKTYLGGELVRYGNDIWSCSYRNGYDFNDIRIPGVSAWQEVTTVVWESAMDYPVHTVALDGDKFYMLLSKDEGYDPLLQPSDESNDYWGEIGEYDKEYEYDYSEGAYDYVVFEGKVYEPILNPNADKLENNTNIIPDDPRNPSLIKHMTQLALYQLHVLISPTNISETRRVQYEDSMAWLYAASKFKIMIDIQRKVNKTDGLPIKDYALATFQKEYDPWENAWVI